jgi:hypothetical protein
MYFTNYDNGINDFTLSNNIVMHDMNDISCLLDVDIKYNEDELAVSCFTMLVQLGTVDRCPVLVIKDKKGSSKIFVVVGEISPWKPINNMSFVQIPMKRS